MRWNKQKLTPGATQPPIPRDGASFLWDEAAVNQLRQYVARELSGSEIAARMGHGLTRSAVLGKMHRLKIGSLIPPTTKKPKAPRAKKPAHALAISGTKPSKRGRVMTPKGDKFAPIEHTAPAAERFAEGYLGQHGKVALADLISGQCRFPIDQPSGGLLYCGDGVTEGSSYCAHHHERCCPGDVRPKRKPRVPFLLERTHFSRM